MCPYIVDDFQLQHAIKGSSNWNDSIIQISNSILSAMLKNDRRRLEQQSVLRFDQVSSVTTLSQLCYFRHKTGRKGM